MVWAFYRAVRAGLIWSVLALAAAPALAAGPAPLDTAPDAIRLLLQSDPDALTAWTQGAETPGRVEARERLLGMLKKVPPQYARDFVARAIAGSDPKWQRQLALQMAQWGYADSKNILRGHFDKVFRALAGQPDNLDALAELVVSPETPPKLLQNYLNVVEGKFYESTIPMGVRRKAAGNLLFSLASRAGRHPEVLGVYDRLHAYGALLPYDAQSFLHDVDDLKLPQLDEWLVERQSVLDGHAKEAWRAPYKPVPGLPETTYQLHAIPKFEPVPGPFESIRRLHQLSYETNYSPERQKFQNELMEKMLANGKKSDFPRLTITAGAMGSGKTTGIGALERKGYFPKGEFVVIDPDLIREQLPEYAEFLKGPYAEYAAHLTQHEAMHIANMMLEKALKDGKNVVLSVSMRDYDHYSRLLERARKTSPNYTFEMLRVERSPEKILALNQRLARRRGRITPIELAVRSIREVEVTAERLKPYFDRVTVLDMNSAPRIKSITNRARPEGKRVAHAFFDLDWTIVYPLPKPASAYAGQGWKVVESEGKAYRLAEHLDELVQEFLSNPRLRLSIASGGTMARNVELLRAIKPPSLEGRSLYDFVEMIISNEDLRDGKAGAKKLDRLKRKAIDEPILVGKDFAQFDDQRGWIKGNGGNGAWTGKTYEYFETWEEAEAAIGNPAFDQRYVPRTRAEWQADRDKLKRFREILAGAAADLPTSKKTFGELVRDQTRLLNWGNLRCWKQAIEAWFAR